MLKLYWQGASKAKVAKHEVNCNAKWQDAKGKARINW